MAAPAQPVGVRELRGKKLAKLRTPARDPLFRKPGALKGKIWTADDWGEWPEGFIVEMTDGETIPK